MKQRLVAVAIMAMTLATVAMRPGPGAMAQSIGFYPSTIDIENGLRGQRYEVSTVLINQSDEPQSFALANRGQTEGWIQFVEPATPETPLTGVTIEPKSEKELTVLVDVPEEAANGPYQGLNSFDGSPPAGNESGGSGVTLSFQQPVAVTVTGDQVLDLRVNDVSATGVEVGQPLRIQVPLTNQSNVAVEPELTAQFFPETATSRADPLDEMENGLGSLRPGGSSTATAEWPTAGQEPGRYWASYSVMLGGDAVAEGEFAFELLPPGSAVRSGAIQSLTVIQPVEAGAIGRADAVFENHGQVESMARFEGQVVQDGVTVAVAESPDALLVHAGEQATLSAYFPLPEDASGKFELRGRVYFEGAQTDEATTAFDLGGDSLLAGKLAMGGAAALLLGALTIGGAWVFQRRR